MDCGDGRGGLVRCGPEEVCLRSAGGPDRGLVGSELDDGKNRVNERTEAGPGRAGAPVGSGLFDGDRWAFLIGA